MATNNAVNTSLAGQTGTGNFVGSTNPTLTTPRIGTIYDPSENLPVISTANPPSAVNYFNFVGQSTGNPPEIQLTGSDTNIGLNLRAKGAGGFQLVSEALTTPFVIYNGTSSQHSTYFIFSNTAASRNVTFPDASGTVAFNDVAYGGTGVNSVTAYSVLCGGTTSTGAFQSVASVGTAGQVLTSNGAGALPSFQNATGGADAAFSLMLMGG